MAELQAGRLLRWFGQLFAVLAAAVLSTGIALETHWALDPHAEAWPTAMSAVAAWVFLQMTALSVMSAGLSRLFEGRCCSW